MTDRSELLRFWTWPGEPALAATESGLINETYGVAVDGAPFAVLQRLNTAIISAAVHEDIAAVTEHLAAAGLDTPRLLPTAAGGLYHTDDDGEAWRVLTWVGHDTVHKLDRHDRARSAGELVARVHAALADFEWDFRSVRPGAHDTEAHLGKLRTALAAFPEHRLYDKVARHADAIFARWENWGGPRELPERIIHGDLKISNVRFDGAHAVALIDLDTFQRGTLDAELGDAFRSWCNPATYEDAIARFDLGMFAAAMQGYARGARSAPPTEAEWQSIVPGIERISVELSARFAVDALREDYFAWDPKYGGHGEHSLVRSVHQLQLARTVAHAAPHAHRAVAEARQGA